MLRLLSVAPWHFGRSAAIPGPDQALGYRLPPVIHGCWGSAFGKADALARIYQGREHEPVTHRNCHLSNPSSNGEFWWLEVPLRKVAADAADPVHLLPSDDRDDTLYRLQVPPAYLRSQQPRLVIRADVGNMSLVLSMARATMFADISPRGGGVQLGQFLQP
jgi:hypothetical protein